jgi:hypothetical protein
VFAYSRKQKLAPVISSGLYISFALPKNLMVKFHSAALVTIAYYRPFALTRNKDNTIWYIFVLWASGAKTGSAQSDKIGAIRSIFIGIIPFG